MVTRVLVGPAATAVERLLHALEDEHFPLVAAFWREATDSRPGELVLVSPEVDRIGILSVYERLQHVLAGLSGRPLTLDDVTAVGASDPVVARLRRAIPDDFPIENLDVRIGVPDETTEAGSPSNVHVLRWRLPSRTHGTQVT